MSKDSSKSNKSKSANPKAESFFSQQNDAFDASNHFPLKSSELISFFSAIERLTSLESKLSYTCRFIVEISQSQSAFLVLFDGNLNITHSFYHIANAESENLLPAFYDKYFSDKSVISPDFFSEIFKPNFQTSFSFFANSENLKKTSLFQETQSNEESEILHTEEENRFPLGNVLFTPLYDPDRLVLGFLAIDFKETPQNIDKLVALTEYLSEALEKHIFSDLYNQSHQGAISSTDFSYLNELTDQVLEKSTVENIAEALSKVVMKIGNLQSTTVAFFDSNDQIHAFSNAQNERVKSQDPTRPFSYAHDGRIEKYICEAIFMTKGFKCDAGYCFSAEQLSLLVYALQSGMTPPKEFSENNLAEANLDDFHFNENIGIFIPIQHEKELLGYINLGTPQGESSKSNLLTAIKKIGFIAGKISDHLWLLKLQADKENEKRKAASIREILSTLVATSSKIYSEEPITDKLHHVVSAIIEFFGLSYAAICTLDEDYTVTHAAYNFHPQSEFLALHSAIERRFQVGYNFTKPTLQKIFSRPFQIEPGYIFKIDQLKKCMRNQPLVYEYRRVSAFTGKTSQATTLSLQNLSDYLNGDETVGLIIPFYGEQNKLIGLISLGGVLLAGGVYELSEMMDRIHIITHFAEQISRDYQLYLIEQQRNFDIQENQRLNQTVSSLFEIGSKIAETENLESKLELLTQAISTTGIDAAVACICDQSGYVKHIKHYLHDSINPKFEKQLLEEYSPGKQIHIEAYNALFHNETLRLSPINIFCADLRQLSHDLSSPETLSAFGTNVLSVVDLKIQENDEPKTGFENLRKYLEQKHMPEQDFYAIATPLTSDFSDNTTLKGILLLGCFTQDLDYDTVLKRFVVIDLFVRTISADLTKFILTQNLQAESEKLLKKNQFIESLLALNVKLAGPCPLFQKLKSVCEQSVANSDFSFVSAVLCDPETYEVTQYLQAKNPRLEGEEIELQPKLPEGATHLNKEFIKTALDSHHKISQSYCFNNAIALNKLPADTNQNTLVFSGCQLVPISDFNQTNETEPLDIDALFESFCRSNSESSTRCSLIIPIQNRKNEILGFLMLGGLLENVSKSKSEVISEVRLIELLVNSLAGSLENMMLNESLMRWDAKFRNASENVEYGIVITDNGNEIEYANVYIKKALGYSDLEILKKPFFDLVDSKSLETAKKSYERALKQSVDISGKKDGVPEFEVDLIAKDGSKIPFQLVSNGQYFMNASGDLTLEGIFLLLIDLRKIREIEKQRREIETIRNNFMAMIVHDMKVPLSAIYGYSDMLKSVSPASMDAEYFVDIMTRIYQSAKNINQLVQEILDFSKYESRQVQLNRQNHNLVLCIDMVLDQNQLALHQKNISIKRQIADDSFIFKFDFDKMARALGNIVSNSLKFSAQDSVIEIHLNKEMHQERPYALLSIKDYGEGIPDNEIEFIFDAYQQAQSKHGSRGTGLGLSITKQIIELHGGEIWAESILKEGTIIHFYLPMLEN